MYRTLRRCKRANQPTSEIEIDGCLKQEGSKSPRLKEKSRAEKKMEELNVRDNRRTTRYSSQRCNSLDAYPYVKAHAVPVKCRDKKHSASNVNTDNRRMTGNVNIYICSEANGRVSISLR